MGPDDYVSVQLTSDEARADTPKTVILPWSGRAVTVTIPAGVADAAVLRLPDLGPPAAGDGAPRDAYVQVRIIPAAAGPTAAMPPVAGPGPYGAPGSAPPAYGPAAYGPSGYVLPPGYRPASGAPGYGQSGYGQSGYGQSGYGPPPVVPAPRATPSAKRPLIIVAAVSAVILAVTIGGIGLASSQDEPETRNAINAPTPAASTGPDDSTVPPVVETSPEQYQAALDKADSALSREFRALGAAKNPKGIRSALSGIENAAEEQSGALASLSPPPAISAAHTDVIEAVGDLAQTASRENSSCVGPAATALIGREPVADKLRAAGQQLAKADPARAYRFGSFVPREVPATNRRLGNGTYVKRPPGGLGQLKIKNGGSDMVVSIVRSGSKTPAARVYVRSKKNFTVYGVPNGTYRIFMTDGKDWDGGRKAFTRDCGFQQFDDTFKWTTTGSTYTIWTITMTPSLGGNAQTSDVDPDQFPS